MKHTFFNNQASNTTTAFVELPPGEYMLALRGGFGSGTVKLQFSVDGANALADLADFTFTAAPEPFVFDIKPGVSVRADLSGATAASLYFDLVGGQ